MKSGKIWIAIAGLILIAVLVNRLMHPLAICCEGAMFLQQAQLLLWGKMPYVDFYDSNLPLIFYLSTIPCWMSAGLGIHPILSFSLFVWILAVISTLSCAIIFSRTARREEWLILGPVLVAIAAINLIVFFDFGERVHLFVVMYLPFFFLRWAAGRGLSVSPGYGFALGIMAGIGAALTPFLAVIPIFVELYWLAKLRSFRRWLSPEIVGALAAAGIYAVHFLLIPSPMREAYFNDILPLLRAGYSSADADASMKLKNLLNMNGTAHSVVYTAIVLLGLAVRRYSSLIIPLVVWTVAAFVAVVLQFKTHGYVYVPVQAALTLLAAVEIGSLIKMTVADRRPMIAALISSLIVIGAGWYLFADYRLGATPLEKVAAVIEQNSRKNDPIMFLTSTALHTYPLTLQLNRVQACRYPQLYVLNTILYLKQKYANDPARLHEIEGAEATLIRNIKDDIRNNRPKVILIEAGSTYPFPASFSVLRYLKERGIVEGISPCYRTLGIIKESVPSNDMAAYVYRDGHCP